MKNKKNGKVREQFYYNIKEKKYFSVLTGKEIKRTKDNKITQKSTKDR